MIPRTDPIISTDPETECSFASGMPSSDRRSATPDVPHLISGAAPIPVIAAMNDAIPISPFALESSFSVNVSGRIA